MGIVGEKSMVVSTGRYEYDVHHGRCNRLKSGGVIG